MCKHFARRKTTALPVRAAWLASGRPRAPCRQRVPPQRWRPWFAAYDQVDTAGRPLDPYRTLPALPLGGGGAGEDVVRGGVGAIRAYRGLLFAPGPAPGVQAGRRRLLLQCYPLDTAAMVMIWTHWLGQAAPPW